MQHYVFSLSVRNIRSMNEFDRLNTLLMGDKSLGIDSVIHYALDNGIFNEEQHTAQFDPTDAVRWSSHEEDMIAISKQLPDMTFRLSGEEEFGDERWEKYFKNGICEECYEERSIPKPQRIDWAE